MIYVFATLWHERNRFLPAVLAVSFATLLTAMQTGLLLGIFSTVSMPIDRSRADVWVGYPGVESVDLCLPIPDAWRSRLCRQPEVERVEPYVRGVVFWGGRGAGVELCPVIGCRLDDEALGPIQDLNADFRERLSEPGSVVVDVSELANLGLHGVGDTAEVSGHRIRVVGLVHGLKGVAGAYLFCSLSTARRLLGMRTGQATYLLARCRHADDAPVVVERLRRAYPDMSVFTSDDFSLRSRLRWMTKTKAGIALGFAALLGLIVGTAVTSQTLYAATATSLREYAVLAALGVPTWRMAAAVLTQSFWVGLLGVLLGLPAVLGFGQFVEVLGAKILLPAWLLGSTAAVTLLMAMLSGGMALRSLRLAEPAILLR